MPKLSNRDIEKIINQAITAQTKKNNPPTQKKQKIRIKFIDALLTLMLLFFFYILGVISEKYFPGSFDHFLGV